MSKSTVTRLFVGGVVAVIAGCVLILAAVLVAIAGGVFRVGGPEVVAVNGGSVALTFVGLVMLGAVAIVGGAIAGLVSWIGALLNTVELQDKTWFVLLLLLGLFSFGWIAMIAYILAGPDGTKQRMTPPEMASAVRT
jgi:hypothetical protein